MKKYLLISMFSLLLMAFGSNAALAQTGSVKGKILDGTTQDPMIGATVLVKGTTTGSTTDVDGNFAIDGIEAGVQVLEVSFVGYSTLSKSVTIEGGKTADLGAFTVAEDITTLAGITVVGVIDVAKDRETPVAVSTIKAAEIQDKLGSQEFPEILASTPSVYATKQGGGFGDARINIRGFNQRNVAVMINGMPVNDMENGWVYWSNWAGLSDVTSAMQVQRGLGSSKLAISSVGGTINVITNTAAQKQGGTLRFGIGNDGYKKMSASYSTGLLENGFSASLLFSRTTGNGYIDGTEFQGHNYFIGLGYKINDNQNLMFTFTGAPQWHNQHSRATEIENYIKYGGTEDEPNRKYNPQWGYLNGDVYTWRRNFYHKPVMSLNWDWHISDASSISTVFYGSWGRGGGSGPIGEYRFTDVDGKSRRYQDFRLPRTAEGQVDFDFIKKFNQGNETISSYGETLTADASLINSRRNAGFSRRASMNSHNWIGVIANFHTEASENISWDLGIDARTYKGIHYRVVNDILGASGYTDSRDKNNPNRTIDQFVDVSPSWNPWDNIKDQQKIEYYNDGGVKWIGGFGQVEYKDDAISAFVQFGASNQSFQRTDYFNLGAHNNTEQASSWESLLGGNIKGGLNYNINANHNVFFNTGFYSKQPLFRAVYPNFNNNDINEGLINEKIFGLEAGYGFINQNVKLNVNIYRTSWKDRFLRVNAGFDTTGDGNNDAFGTADLSGVEQVHTGIELEGSVNIDKLKIEGMLSVGNWEYKSDVTARYFDENNDPIIEAGQTQPKEKQLFLAGKKVGDAAQMTARIGLSYEITEGLYVDISDRFASNLYARIDAPDFQNEDTESLKLPSYSVIDLGMSYRYKFKNDKNALKLRVNINNLTDKLYISESATNREADADDTNNWNGINKSNRVFWGFGRTWNATLTFDF